MGKSLPNLEDLCWVYLSFLLVHVSKEHLCGIRLLSISRRESQGVEEVTSFKGGIGTLIISTLSNLHIYFHAPVFFSSIGGGEIGEALEEPFEILFSLTTKLVVADLAMWEKEILYLEEGDLLQVWGGSK